MSPKRVPVDKKKLKRQKKDAAAGTAAAPTPMRLFRPRQGQLFAVVLRMLGGNHIEVQCQDGEKRMARIPGKIRRRKWVRVGDLVVVEPWWGVEESKADLKERFRDTQVRAYLERGMLRGLEDFVRK